MEKNNQFHQIKDYLTEFISNIRENDPLPVRAPSYEVSDSEIDGQILDIVYHYLNHRDSHPYIRHLVAHRVWNQMRNTDETDGMRNNKLPYYDSMKLIKDVTNSANSMIKDILYNLSPSVTDSIPHYLPISHYCIKNSRRKMEDRCVILQDLNTLYDMKFGYPHAYYGVFDGHCGPDGAVYAAAHLHQFLIQNPLYETNLVAALKHAFHICDTNFIKHSKTERLKGGTTAVVALVRENRLVVAWLGDSQALLVRKRKAAHVGEPHTPSRECERKRIDDMGGAVLEIAGTWRVLGQLAVSRAIGDADYKPYVSSECDIKSLEISGDEDFLILACDGLWDTLSPKEAVNLVYAYLTQNDGDTDGVGKCLVEAARIAGSEDNITAVVVFLRPVATLMEEEIARVERGEVTDSGQVIPVTKEPNFLTNLFSQPLIAKEVDKGTNNFTADMNDQISSDVPPFEEPAPDYDIDIVAESDAVPTDEEVDAVLAELDSIPDAPEDNEDSSDEEWTYAKVEPRMDCQIDDILPDTVFNQDTLIAESPVDSSNKFEIDPSTDIDCAISTPPIIENQLKSVQGFITSVELNATEETFPVDVKDPNLSVEKIEQTSGPFSIYVSSSPESASMEDIPLTQASMTSVSQEVIDIEEPTSDVCKESFSVEIVHAQSTIEVMPNSLKEDFPADKIPDIMTQSFTGEIPVVPCNLLDLDQSPIDAVVELDSILDLDTELCLPYTSNDNQNSLPIEQLMEDINIESNTEIDSAIITFVENSLNIEQPPLQEENIDMKSPIDLIDKLEESSITDAVENTCPRVTGSLLKEEFDNLETSPIIDEKVDLIEEIQNVSTDNHISDLFPINESSLATSNEKNLLSMDEVCDLKLENNVAEEKETIPAEVKLLESPEKPDEQIKEIVPIIPTKKVTSSVQAKKTTKDAPRQAVRTITKVDRSAPRKTTTPKELSKPTTPKEVSKPTTKEVSKPTTLKELPKPTTPKELSKPLLKKDTPVVKKTVAKRTTNTTQGIVKSNLPETKLFKGPKSLITKSPAPKPSEIHSQTSKPASSVAERVKPSSNLVSRTKTVTKTSEKGTLPAKTSNVSTPPRRPLTAPRRTTTSTARSGVPLTTRSAVFATPTKDSKNTANKLLSAKSTTISTSNRTKVLNKTAPITQKRGNIAGTKTKCSDTLSPLVKGKEEIVTNGTAKNTEKESFVEKSQVINGES